MEVSRRRTEIVNYLGLHLRAAAQFVQLARSFDAEVVVLLGDRAVDGKSVLDLATLAAECGMRLEIQARGADAGEAAAALASLVEAGFHEVDPPGHDDRRAAGPG